MYGHVVVAVFTPWTILMVLMEPIRRNSVGDSRLHPWTKVECMNWGSSCVVCIYKQYAALHDAKLHKNRARSTINTTIDNYVFIFIYRSIYNIRSRSIYYLKLLCYTTRLYLFRRLLITVAQTPRLSSLLALDWRPSTHSRRRYVNYSSAKASRTSKKNGRSLVIRRLLM